MGNNTSKPTETPKNKEKKKNKKRSQTIYETNNNTTDFINSERINNENIKIDSTINNNNESKFENKTVENKEDNQLQNDNNNNADKQINENINIIDNSGNPTNINNINTTNITNINSNNKEEEEIYEINLKRRGMTRANTYFNINQRKNIDIIPSNSEIFENINIFNSILIIMNNISFINNYFSNPIVNNIIYNCTIHNKPYCLSHILYYMHKYLWNLEGKYKISEKNLFIEYKNFIDYYSQNFLKELNEDKYYKDNKMAGIILENIYNKINAELSFEKKKEFKKIINENDPIFSQYFNEFRENNCSIISEGIIPLKGNVIIVLEG